MPLTTTAELVIVGSGMTGLSAAILLARDGHRVTVLDRDRESPPERIEDAWTRWDRPGVSHFRQLHITLPRWTQVMTRRLPEVLDTLTAIGGTRVNLLHLLPSSVTAGWQPGDEQFDTVTARRPILETALARVAASTPGLTIRRGVSVTGLVMEPGPLGVPRVVGVRTRDGKVAADLVIDAGGRHTPLPRMVREAGCRKPLDTRSESGIVYYPRHYRHPGMRTPVGRAGALTHHESFSVLTLPADRGTCSVAILTCAKDLALRSLRGTRVWEAAVRSIPAAAHWIHAEPLTDVMPFAGLQDIQRSYVVDGAPVVTGLLAVGDAVNATNPSLGRGMSLGLLNACVLCDVLASDPELGSAELSLAYASETDSVLGPLVGATIDFGQHRVAEMEAEMAGRTYQSGAGSWRFTTALMAGARSDPHLTRAYSRIGCLLAPPSEVLADAQIQTRLGPFFGAPRYPSGDCTRSHLLRAIEPNTAATPSTGLSHVALS